MSDNVLILGAGFSFDAGVPLMTQFVETMWAITARGSYMGEKLSPEDVDLFSRAAQIRQTLDGYHGRANFDDRNIEDILSILAFNAFANDTTAAAQLKVINRAIARTIEITCKVKHPGFMDPGTQLDPVPHKYTVYLNFWYLLLSWAAKGNGFPTIITFNYDLVLERSLFQTLVGPILENRRASVFPKKHIRIKYYNENLPSLFYSVDDFGFYDAPNNRIARGTILNRSSAISSDSEMDIEILKLHGSVNFPSSSNSVGQDYNVTQALADPQILPPIFNKFSDTSNNKVWEIALQRLRSARNLVIVGYSLPRTDIYMQYFLKAALGPNIDFDRLTIYDPTLYKEGAGNTEMRERYLDCLAPQMKDRIIYQPTTYLPDQQRMLCGTTFDFVSTLANNPASVFFEA